MKLSWRCLTARETDHELLWLSISLASLAGAATWLGLHLPWPLCVFHAITGHPCATCGATRSAIAFFHADFLAAWRWNPLALVFFCGVTAFDVYASIVLVMRAPRLRIVQLTSTEKSFTRIVVVSLLTLNWIYLLISNPPL